MKLDGGCVHEHMSVDDNGVKSARNVPIINRQIWHEPPNIDRRGLPSKMS